MGAHTPTGVPGPVDRVQPAANMGTWMQTVGAQWLMGDLGGGALEVAPVRTATALPVFVPVVSAGALGTSSTNGGC